MENPKQTSIPQDPTEAAQESPEVQHSGIDEGDFDDETATKMWDTRTVSELLRDDTPTTTEKRENELADEVTEASKKHGKGVLRLLNSRRK
jgi:hypothetical protein